MQGSQALLIACALASALACAGCSDERGVTATRVAPELPAATAAPAATESPAAATARATADPTAEPAEDPATLFARPIVIGASASDGFGVSVRENGARPGDGVSVSLADILRVASRTPRTVEAYASSMAFANPGPVLSGEIERALRQSPTLVIGIDYLFWYVYGTVDAVGAPMRSREQRLENLERGLAMVDRVLERRIPCIVGDIPDMKAAIGKMLSRAQVPDAATLDAVNARIRDWAASRPGARVFALRESVSSIGENGHMRAGGTLWSVDDHGSLLLRDELHPSFAGSVALASAVIESAATLLPEGSREPFESQFEFDPALLRRRLLDGRASTRTPAGQP